MAGEDEAGIPARDGALSEQVTNEHDPRDVGHDPSMTADEMPIDSSRLFEQAAEQTRMALCISDPHGPDEPIVFVNQAFVELTGYPRDEIVGRNCRFLQGPATDAASVAEVRAALAERRVRVIELLNYRKDGTPFWNALHVGPIFDEAGRLTHYYGSQWDVTDLREARDKAALGSMVAEELKHRTKNLFAVMSAILRLSAVGARDVDSLVETALSRIDALARAHDASVSLGEGVETDIHGLVEAILKPYRHEAGSTIEVAGPARRLEREQVTPLGLALHELATNSLKYGALSGGGRLRVDWEPSGEAIEIHWTERGTAAAEGGTGRDGTGTRLLRSVLQVAGGSFETRRAPEGVTAVIRL